MKHNPKKLISKKWIIIVIILIIIISGIVMMPAKKVSVTTAKAEKNNIKSYITQQAKTHLKNVYKITMPYSSRINAVNLTPGSTVKNGEVVASLVLTDINAEYAIVESELQEINSQIELNEYRNFVTTALKESMEWIKTMKQLLGITKIKITASQHALEYAMQHKNALIQSGRAVSRIEKNEAEMEAAVKEVELESSRLAYSAMGIFTDIWKLLPKYINEYIKTLDMKKEILLAQKKQAEAKISIVTNNKELAIMKSPVDGIVLERYVSNERYLPIGNNILDIGTMKDLEVEANVLTTDVINVKVGNKVEIVSAAGEGSLMNGTVSQIEPQGFTDISSLGVKQQKVKIKISFDKGELARVEDSGYTYGVEYRVYIKIFTSEAKNAIIIPRTALFKGENGQWNVFTVENDTAKLKIVKVGILNDEQAQITSGLKINDEVIIAPPTSLTDSTKVKSI